MSPSPIDFNGLDTAVHGPVRLGVLTALQMDGRPPPPGVDPSGGSNRRWGQNPAYRPACITPGPRLLRWGRGFSPRSSATGECEQVATACAAGVAEVAHVVLLDAGPLSMITHPRRHPEIKTWLQARVRAGASVLVPEIALAKIEKVFNLPTVLTTSYSQGPNGPFLPEIVKMHPDADPCLAARSYLAPEQ